MKSVLPLAAAFVIAAATARAAVLTGPVKRLYTENGVMTVHLTTQPPSVCPNGMRATESDPAYDRWISMLMAAYTNAPPTPISVNYDSTTCKVLFLYFGS